MFEALAEDGWPFTPTRLSELIDEETLSVIQSGCSERLGRPLVVLDYDPAADRFIHRIESLNLRQRFEGFCATFRDKIPGGEEACWQCNLREADRSLRAFRESGDPYRAFRCHLGLLEATYVIQVQNRPVALLYSGQYLPPEGFDRVRETVEALGQGGDRRLEVDDSIREEMLTWAVNLPAAPEDLPARLQREAEHIQRMAEAEYRQLKYQWEQEFLDTVWETVSYEDSVGLAQLRGSLDSLLARICAFCRCAYAVFFASVQPEDTVLPPLASAGIPEEVQSSLPHFNWKKAGLPLEQFDARRWNLVDRCHEVRDRGIRGDNSEFFARAACLIPSSLGDRYRGALLFGPFAEAVDLQEERRFLLNLAEAVSSLALIRLELRSLERERSSWQSRARLIIHQLSTAVTPMTTQAGWAKFLVKKLDANPTTGRLIDLLARSEDLGLHLRDSARKTVESYTLLLEQDDFDFEFYPLSVLVANCAEGFGPAASKRHRQLTVDESVEMLPEARVDVARLTIALSNLIDNAIKYSFPGTEIRVRASVEGVGRPGEAAALVVIDDLGDEIRQQDRERIFEEGTRGLTAAKMGRIPGSGLGLWEARAVVEAHGGKISVTCEPTRIRRRQGPAYRVVFTVRIPLGQREAMEGR